MGRLIDRFKPSKPFRVDIELNGDLYLRRWNIVRLFGWTMRLHKFFRPDADRCLHTHPWPFFTFCLLGGYEEETPDGINVVKQFRGYWRPKTHTHRITRLTRTPTWTLVFTKAQEQSWGFMTNKGYMPWRNFVAGSEEQKVLWCDTEGDQDRTKAALRRMAEISNDAGEGY